MAVLPDLLAPDLAIVFCGTAVGNVSVQSKVQYAGPGKMFYTHPALLDVLTAWELMTPP